MRARSCFLASIVVISSSHKPVSNRRRAGATVDSCVEVMYATLARRRSFNRFSAIPLEKQSDRLSDEEKLKPFRVLGRSLLAHAEVRIRCRYIYDERCLPILLSGGKSLGAGLGSKSRRMISEIVDGTHSIPRQSVEVCKRLTPSYRYR